MSAGEVRVRITRLVILAFAGTVAPATRQAAGTAAAVPTRRLGAACGAGWRTILVLSAAPCCRGARPCHPCRAVRDHPQPQEKMQPFLKRKATGTRRVAGVTKPGDGPAQASRGLRAHAVRARTLPGWDKDLCRACDDHCWSEQFVGAVIRAPVASA